MRADIRPDAIFPDYSLPDHTDSIRKLSELQGDDRWSLSWRGAITARKSISSILS